MSLYDGKRGILVENARVLMKISAEVVFWFIVSLIILGMINWLYQDFWNLV